MRRSSMFVLTAVVLGCAIVGASAQDPTRAAPESYRLQFENEWVRVLRVTYAPHSKVPTHDHSRFPAGYVYLTDAGPIHFTHTGWEHPVLTRPATKAGSFRLSPTRFEDETHAVENRGDKTSEFLRIEFRTEAPDRQSLVGRFPAYAGDRRQGLERVEFDNTQLRVTRLISRTDKRLDVVAPADAPSLVVVISDTRPDPQLAAGETFWLKAASGHPKLVVAPGERAGQVELLRFDLKTKPKP